MVVAASCLGAETRTILEQNQWSVSRKVDDQSLIWRASVFVHRVKTKRLTSWVSVLQRRQTSSCPHAASGVIKKHITAAASQHPCCCSSCCLWLIISVLFLCFQLIRLQKETPWQDLGKLKIMSEVMRKSELHLLCSIWRPAGCALGGNGAALLLADRRWESGGEAAENYKPKLQRREENVWSQLLLLTDESTKGWDQTLIRQEALWLTASCCTSCQTPEAKLSKLMNIERIFTPAVQKLFSV